MLDAKHRRSLRGALHIIDYNMILSGRSNLPEQAERNKDYLTD
jgi:hypothetical protein